MTPRTARLRQESLDAPPALTAERASLLTDFYQANEGKYSVPVMRARSFLTSAATRRSTWAMES